MRPARPAARRRAAMRAASWSEMDAVREGDHGTRAKSGRDAVIVRAEALTKQVATPDHVLTIVKHATFEARAFVPEPRLLFADEPTGNLDSETGEQVIDLLFEMNRERGTTLVLVTHDAELAKRCARRLHIAAGEITHED